MFKHVAIIIGYIYIYEQFSSLCTFLKYILYLFLEVKAEDFSLDEMKRFHGLCLDDSIFEEDDLID